MYTGLTGTPAKEEDWSLDPLGNWSNFIQKSSGTTDLNQSRLVNKVNEITDFTETVGPSWITPAYDRNGNMTTIPKPADPTTSFTATYDAWNHLVKVQSGSSTVATYAYDGVHRRVTTTSDSTTRHFYYTTSWQAIEERLGISSSPDRQFIWGPLYIDHLILRDRDTDANGTLDERLYALQDATWNVTALADTSGGAVERYRYAPYGALTFMDESFASRSASDYDSSDTFTGRRLETDTGLYHVRARQYHGQTGAFAARDPIQAEINLYRYCANNPVMLVDPSGLKWIVKREGQGLAECCRENSGDTFAMLADQVGLDAGDYNKWLTEKDGRYFVPNTVYAIWAGENILTLPGLNLNLGKGAVKWNDDVK